MDINEILIAKSDKYGHIPKYAKVVIYKKIHIKPFLINYGVRYDNITMMLYEKEMLENFWTIAEHRRFIIEDLIS